jgi:hypothetical protein
MIRDGKTGRGEGGDSHVHYNVTHNVQALDSDGLDRVFTKHDGVLKKHFASHMRRQNR